MADIPDAEMINVLVGAVPKISPEDELKMVQYLEDKSLIAEACNYTTWEGIANSIPHHSTLRIFMHFVTSVLPRAELIFQKRKEISKLIGELEHFYVAREPPKHVPLPPLNLPSTSQREIVELSSDSDETSEERVSTSVKRKREAADAPGGLLKRSKRLAQNLEPEMMGVSKEGQRNRQRGRMSRGAPSRQDLQGSTVRNPFADVAQWDAAGDVGGLRPIHIHCDVINIINNGPGPSQPR